MDETGSGIRKASVKGEAQRTGSSGGQKKGTGAAGKAQEHRVSERRDSGNRSTERKASGGRGAEGRVPGNRSMERSSPEGRSSEGRASGNRSPERRTQEGRDAGHRRDVESSRRRKKSLHKSEGIHPGIAAGAAVVIVAVIVILLIFRSCSSSTRSAEGVVKALLSAEIEGNKGKIKDYYGVNGDPTTDLAAEIDATVKYYTAHNVNKLSILSTDTLFEKENYSYVAAFYNLVLENGQEYPCVATFMVQNSDEKYTIMAPEKISDEMSVEAQKAYEKLMTTDAYKDYTKAYDTFIKKNPGYEDKIASKIL